LAGSRSGLTGAPTGLTGTETGLTGASSEPGNSSKAKNKARPSFKELVAKYEKKRAAKKQKRWPNKTKDTKPLFEHQEQSDSQGNYVAVPYSFDGPIAPWFWPYPYCYTPLDYSRMHMQSYYIQYLSMYSSCTSQRPIVASNNLVKRDFCSKESEKNVKQDSKYLQSRWCRLGLSHTQKRRLQ